MSSMAVMRCVATPLRRHSLATAMLQRYAHFCEQQRQQQQQYHVCALSTQLLPVGDGVLVRVRCHMDRLLSVQCARTNLLMSGCA
jgi:hypothetical protein